MEFIVSLVLLAVTMVTGQNGPYQQKYPLILTHKQGLSGDGSFNYAFTADNGLSQGEMILPDGSRTGSYSYIDPNGKKVLLRYTAGKEGFKVLEGDHIPKPVPVPVQQQQQLPVGNQIQYNQGPQSFYQQDGQPPSSQVYPVHNRNYFQPQSGYQGQSGRGFYQTRLGNSAPVQENNRYEHQTSQQESDFYNNQPHSFGNGYSFEFNG